jgi:hypothetical protein
MEKPESLKSSWARRVNELNAKANEQWSRSERVFRVQVEANQCGEAAGGWLNREVADEELLERIIGSVVVNLGALAQFDEDQVAIAWDMVLSRFDCAIAAKVGDK